MIVLLAALAGFVVGALRARSRQGKLVDVLQYAVVYGIVFALVGLFVTIFIHRSAI